MIPEKGKTYHIHYTDPEQSESIHYVGSGVYTGDTVKEHVGPPLYIFELPIDELGSFGETDIKYELKKQNNMSLETDILVKNDDGGSGFIKELADLGHRLERERNALQKEIERLNSELSNIYKLVTRNHPDGFVDSLSYAANVERCLERLYERVEALEKTK